VRGLWAVEHNPYLPFNLVFRCLKAQKPHTAGTLPLGHVDGFFSAGESTCSCFPVALHSGLGVVWHEEPAGVICWGA